MQSLALNVYVHNEKRWSKMSGFTMGALTWNVYKENIESDLICTYMSWVLQDRCLVIVSHYGPYDTSV